MAISFQTRPCDPGADATGRQLLELFNASQRENAGRSVVCKIDLNHEVRSSGEELSVWLMSLRCERFVKVVGSNEVHSLNLVAAA